MSTTDYHRPGGERERGCVYNSVSSKNPDRFLVPALENQDSNIGDVMPRTEDPTSRRPVHDLPHPYNLEQQTAVINGIHQAGILSHKKEQPEITKHLRTA